MMSNRSIWLFNYIINIALYFLVAVILTSCASGGSSRHPASIDKGVHPASIDKGVHPASIDKGVLLWSLFRPPASIDKGVPLSHVWQYLHSYGDEEHGYATYSYVLVGRDYSNQKSTSLYYELVKAIQASTVSAENLKDYISSSSLNLFIIPISDASNNEQKEPNYELSKSLLASLSITSPLKFSRPGPYIITLYQPISVNHGNKMADILYIDLTDAHQKAIPEIVRTYREKVTDEKLDGIEKLKSLRLSLLNIALHTEDSIGFAKSAYAGMRSAFSE